MTTKLADTEAVADGGYEPWYKWGVLFLYLEMAIAVAVSVYSLYMAFTGKGGFPGKH